MRNVLLFPLATLLFLTAPVASYAAPARSSGAPVQMKTDENRLDTLFESLKRERNEKAAERIASRIADAWNHSGSASVDLMMVWAKKAMDARKFDVALDFLDQVVTLRPDYAEGWNRRATAHYLMNNTRMAMADINRTLQLEPRHFGALAGMARILKDNGNKELALNAWERVLAAYPMMRNAQNEVSTLSEELAGERI
jgi:tetratricopeptide (TPR) repeat protein